MQKKYLLLVFLLIINIYAYNQIDNPDFIRARTEMKYNNYEKAIKLFTNLIRSNISLKQSYLNRGICLLNENFTENAISDFTEANNRGCKLSYLYLAVGYAKQNNATKATYYLAQYLSQKNKLLISTVKKQKYFRNIKDSVAWKELWKKDWYNKYELELNHCYYLFNTGKYIEAIEAANSLLNNKPHYAEAYFIEAQSYFKTGMFKLALESNNNAIKFKRKNIDYYLLRADILMQLNKYSKALNDINTAISIDKNMLRSYFKRAICLNKLGRYDEAKSDMNMYLNFEYNDEDGYYQNGMIFFNKGDYMNALLNFSHSIEIKPANLKSFIARADTYLKTKTYKYAIIDYSMALDIDPKNGETYYKRALARFALNINDLACTDLHKALNLGNTDANNLIYEKCK